MKKILQQIKWDAILLSVLYIVLGVVCIVIPETMFTVLGYLLGALLIIAGAVSMICYLLRDAHQNYYRNDFVYGLVSIAIGIVVLYKVEELLKLVPIILGILVIASGCRKLQDVIDMKRMDYGNWVMMLVLATINVVFGVVLVLNPFESLLLFFQLIGGALIFSGITDGIIILYFAGKIKKYHERMTAVDSSYAEVTTQKTSAEKEQPISKPQPTQDSEAEKEPEEGETAEEVGEKVESIDENREDEKGEGTEQ